MSVRLTPLVGDLETAQKTFWSLNGLKDETATATDKLAKAFVDLGNNGLNNSNEQLKTYATIANGTVRDINSLTDAVIVFSQGSTKALRQFGITAKDNGDTISLSYKGSTTEIQKNSKALDEYLSNLARNNFDGVMEPSSTLYLPLPEDRIMSGEHSARDSCSLTEASENSSSWVMTFWPTP